MAKVNKDGSPKRFSIAGFLLGFFLGPLGALLAFILSSRGGVVDYDMRRWGLYGMLLQAVADIALIAIGVTVAMLNEPVAVGALRAAHDEVMSQVAEQSASATPISLG